MNLPNLFNKTAKKKESSPEKSPKVSTRKYSHDSGASAPPSPEKRQPSPEKKPASPEKKSHSSRISSRERSERRPSTHSTKSFSKKKSHEEYTHPLNLPPDEYKRLSALSNTSAMSSPSEAPTPMDVDREATASPTPQSPQENGTPKAPGAFPNLNGVNGHKDEENVAGPPPPPHKTPTTTPPTVDAEACKAAGNKFFKAGNYNKAIEEYSKGGKALVTGKSC